jgi:hypothetical protein
MATVPRSPDSFTVAPTSLPGSRLTVPEYQDFGSQQMQRTGQALTAAGGAAQKAAMEAVDEVNKIRINAAMNKAVAARMRLTYDDAEGFTSKKGEAAVNYSKDKSLDQDYTERYQKEIDDIANSLGNEEQRKMFRASVGGEFNRFVGAVKSHLSTELGNYEKAERSSAVELGQNMGAREWDKPDSVARARQVIVNAIGSDASLSPEQKADQTIKALSPMHAAVVAAALEKNNTSYAREYLKQFDTELTEDARLRLHKAVDIGDNRVKAQTFGDEMLDSGKTQVEALAEARKRFTGPERDAAETRLKDIYSTLNAAEQRDKKALVDRGWSQIMTNGRLSAATEAELADKAPEELRQIRDWQDAKRRQAEGHDPVKAGMYYDMLMMAAEQPEKFVQMDLKRLDPFLYVSDFKRLGEVQAGLVKGDRKKMAETQMVKDTLNAIKAEVARIGVDLTPKEGSAAARETAIFVDTLGRALTEEVAKNDGKPLTPEQMKAVGMRMVREGIEQDALLWRSRKPGYQIESDPNLKGTYVAKRYGDIPDEVRQELLDTYLRMNPDAQVIRSRDGKVRSITRDAERAIERAYTKGLNEGRFK